MIKNMEDNQEMINIIAHNEANMIELSPKGTSNIPLIINQENTANTNTTPPNGNNKTNFLV